MGTLYLGTSRRVRNPVRAQNWNCSIAAGEDFKLALTLYDDDAGTPTLVRSSRSQITIIPDEERNNFTFDYGLGWSTTQHRIIAIPGYVVYPAAPGRINFYMPARQTACLPGRYKLSLFVDLEDGEYLELQGVLQVRGVWNQSPGHHVAYFQLDRSQLDGNERLSDVLGLDGVPLDVDGFPALGDGFVPSAQVHPVSSNTSPILNQGCLNQMVLCGSGSSDGSSPVLNQGVLNQMILAGSSSSGGSSSVLNEGVLNQMILDG